MARSKGTAEVRFGTKKGGGKKSAPTSGGTASGATKSGRGKGRRGAPPTGARRWLIPVLGSLVLLVVAYLAWNRLAPPFRPRLPGPPTQGREAVHLGFDTADYPGDRAMRALRTGGVFEWVGYYLQSDNHPDGSWKGRWVKTLRDAQWKVAVIYVGQQKSKLSDVQARLDAVEASQRAQAEGFPPGAYIYLDVEAEGDTGALLERYVRVFMRALEDEGVYHPGVYCHAHNARALSALLDAEARRIPVWVAGGSGFDMTTSPARSALPSATAWQGLLDAVDPTGVTRLKMDVSTSITATPSGF